MSNIYNSDYNPIIEYWNLMESGEIVVCDKIYRTYKKLVFDVTSNGSIYYYSTTRGNHVIEFIERYCKHSKGKLGGKRIVLELWEKAFLAVVFGFIDIEGNRQYREVLLIVGKKNGKSLLASAIGLYLQIADQEPGAEIYAVATKKDQAKIIWEEAKRMVKKSPALRKRIKPLVSSLISDFNDGTFKPLASDSDTLDGLNVHGALLDEIHQWKNGRALFNIIVDGVSSREQPLIFMTSTAGTIREDLYDEKYDESERVINGYFDPEGYKDDHFVAFIYELDKRAEWKNPKKWGKANPGLGTIKNEKILAAKVDKAKENPMLVKNLVCKEFNIRETTTETWLTFDQLNNIELFNISELKPRYGIGGVDLSSKIDLTAAKLIFMVPDDPHVYVLAMYWLPEDIIEKRSIEDKIPYDLWRDQGLLRTTPGNSVHPKYVTKWFLEMKEEHDIYMPWFGYDVWAANYWVDEMKGVFGISSPIKIRQTKQTLSGPMKQLGADLESKLINYNNNPIDKWCLANTKSDTDKNGFIQPSKTSSTRKRIDGTSALLNALAVLQDKRNEYEIMI